MPPIELRSAAFPREHAQTGVAPAPDAVIKVDLDERAYLFPQGKQVLQLHVLAYRPHMIRLEATFAFNEARASHELFELTADDARDLVRRLVEAVYRAQSGQVVSRTTTLSIAVVANGYIVQVGDHEQMRELFLSTSCIWRVCSGIARAVDFIAPIQSN